MSGSITVILSLVAQQSTSEILSLPPSPLEIAAENSSSAASVFPSALFPDAFFSFTSAFV